MTFASISCVRFTSAGEADVERGLLGFVALTLDGVVELHGLAVRRTAIGRLSLAYPERLGRRGRRHQIVRPASAAARAAIEEQVFAALKLEAGL